MVGLVSLGPPNTSPVDNPFVTISRTELLLILLIAVLGAALRFVRVDDLAIEHFDEGVYASNLIFTAEEGYQYPQRFLYAPPLLPSLVEWSQILTGGASWAPFLPGLLLGSLTVPLIWLFVRRCFSPAGGLAAASLVALNDFHISLSRSALTDVPLGFFLVLAVWLAVEALASGRLRWAVGAGIASGLAWSTKYNGWLPLAVLSSGGAAAVIVAQWLARLSRRGASVDGSKQRKVSFGKRDATHDEPAVVLPGWARLTKTLSVAGVLAVVVWSPVWFDLQDVGGYSVVAANHRQYVTGFAGWWDAVGRQGEALEYGAGLFTFLGGWLAVLSITLLNVFDRSTWNELWCQSAVSRSTGNESEANQRVERSTWNARMPWQASLIVGTIAGSVIMAPLAMWVFLASFGFGRGLMRLGRHKGSDSRDESTLFWRLLWTSHWMGLAWLCGLLLATPFYRPYPRLLIPLLCVCWVGAGVALDRVASVYRRMYADSAPLAWTRARKVGQIPRSVLLLAVACLSLAVAGGRTGSAWQLRDDVVSVADRCIEEAGANCRGESSSAGGIDFVIYVYGEPALVYHLSRERVLARPVAKLDVAHNGIPTFVATGPHAERSPQFAEQLRQAGDSLTLVARIAYRLSDFVLLDEYAPRELDDNRVEEIRLYRVR
jgi:dolichyl-phosphate-mannose-protein mannosyltransferase